MSLLYLCSFLIILGYDCTSPRSLTLSRVRIPSLRMFQSWFVVSDLQCFCPLCSNRRAFAFGKRQLRGGASPLPLSERCLNLKKVDTLWLQKYKIILMCTKKVQFQWKAALKKVHDASRYRCALQKKRCDQRSQRSYCGSFPKYKKLQRKERDSNPRTLAGQRFSRPPHSTALPSFLLPFSVLHGYAHLRTMVQIYEDCATWQKKVVLGVEKNT